jgi:hypothetical protein
MMDPLTLTSSSVVVLDRDGKLESLNPMELKARDITPSDWMLEADTLSMPNLLFANYQSGCSIRIDPSRLQIIDANFRKNACESLIALLASNYIKTLKSISPTAIGLNFDAIWRMESAEEKIVRMFVKDGIERLDKNQYSDFVTAGVKLVFRTNGGESKTTISLNPGQVCPKEEDAIFGIIVSANYHWDFETEDPENRRRKILDILSRYTKYCVGFRDLVVSLLKQTTSNIT